MNTVLQDPASVGTLWKTMSARIRGAKTELQELGEEQDEFTASTSKLQKLIKSVTGFDIMKDKDTFKDIYEIVVGIGEAWPKLSDIEKASIGEALAGKRGANGLFAVLDNLDTLKSAYETAENSAGSAAKEQANYEKSIQYSLDRLKASAEEFSNTFLSSDLVKKVVDFGNAFIGTMTNIDNTVGSLTTLSSIITGILSMTGKFRLFDIDKNDNGFNITSVFSGGIGGKKLIDQNTLDMMNIFNLKMKELGEVGKDTTRVLDILENEGHQISPEFRQMAQDVDETGFQLEEFTTKSKASALAMNLLTAAINIGATVAITGLISVISELITYQDKMNQKASEVGQSYSDSVKNLEDYNNKIKELKGITIESGASINEVSQARTELMSIQDQIISKYGKESQAIDLVTSSLANQDSVYQKLQKDAYAKMVADFNADEDGLIAGSIDYWKNTFRSLSGDNRTKFQIQMDQMENFDFSSVTDNPVIQSWFKNFKGTIYQALDFVEEVREETEKFGGNTTDLDTVYSKIDEIISKNADAHAAYVYNEKILKNADYSKIYDDINSAASDYEKAKINGDQAEIEKAAENYGQILAEGLSKIKPNDTSVKDYLTNLHSELNSDIGAWTFEYNVKPKSNEEKGLKNDLEWFRDSDTLKKYGDAGYGTAAERDAAYDRLKKMQEEYGFSTFEDFVDYLVSNGYIFTADYQDLIEQFGEKNVKSLSEEDLAVTYTLQNVGDMSFEQLREELAYINNKSLVSFKKAWNDVTEEEKEARDELIELAKTGKLTTKTFDSNIFGKKLKDETGKDVDFLINKINKLVDDISQLSNMKTGISGILDIYDKKRDSKDNRVDATSLNSLGDTLEVDKWEKPDIKIWQKYKKVAGQANYTLVDLKKAQDDLATSFVNTNNFLQKLDDTNKDYYRNLLTEMGVVNAAEVVASSYAKKMIELDDATFRATIQNINFEDASQDTINQLADQMDQTYGTSEALGNYILQMAIASNSSLKTDGSISNLLALARQCGATAEAILMVQTLQENLSSFDNKWKTRIKNSKNANEQNALTSEWNKRRRAKITKAENKIKTFTEVETKEGSTSNSDPSGKGSPSSDKDKTKNKQYIDWIERRITRINNIISQLSSSVENIGKWIPKIARKDKDFAWIDKFNKIGDKWDTKTVKLRNKNLKKQFGDYKKLFKMQQEAEQEYQKKADRLEFQRNKKGKIIKDKNGKKQRNIPAEVITKIQSGDYTDRDLKYWFDKYGDKKYNKIQSYIDYYDKAQSARQGKQETVQAMRENRIQRKQNWVDLYDARKARAEAKEFIAIGYLDQNTSVETQLRNLKKSYDKQKEIAKLNKDKAELQRLEYEYEQQSRELLYHEIENIKDNFEQLRGVNNRRIQDAQNLIDVAQAEGHRVNVGWYQSKNLNERENISSYKEERQKIVEKLNTLVKGSKEWYQAQEDLQETENNIAESSQNIAENLASIRDEIDSVYDEMRENNNFVYEQAQFMSGLLREDSINTRDRDNGYYQFSSAGVARMSTANTGIGVANDNIEKDLRQYNSLQRYKDAIKDMSVEEADAYLKEMYEKDNTWIYDSYQHLMDADKKYTKQYMDDVKARQEAENQMIDLMKEYYEGQKSYLGEMIDARKKLLDEEKDLYDYEKNINEKTKNIATLQKRLVALRGDTSEEGRARRRQIENQLDQAQQDLQDTEYERWKTDQENMLTNLQEQFNDIVDQHMKDPNKLLGEAKEFLSENQPRITAAVEEMSREIDDSIMPAFTTAEEALKKADTSGVVTTLTTANSYLEQILNKIPTQLNNATTVPDSKNGDPTTNTTSTTSDINDIIGKNHVDNLGKNNVDNHGLLAKDPETRTLVDALNTYGSSDGDKTNALNKALIKFSKEVMGKTLMLPNNSKYKKFASYISEQLGTASLLDKDGKADWTKNSKLYKKLKSYGLSGFKTGGIGTLVKASGEDGLAMVRNGEGFVAPEHVQSIQQLLKVTPDLTQVMSNKNNTNQTTIDTLRLELPNVQDVRGFVEEFQTNKEVQRIFSIGVNDLLKTGHLTSNIHRL